MSGDFDPMPERFKQPGMTPAEYIEWVKEQFRKNGWVEMPGDQARQLVGEQE